MRPGRMWPPGPFYAAPGPSLKSRAGRKNYDCNLLIVQFYMESKTYIQSLDFTKIYIFHSISTYHRKFIWDQDWSLTTIFKPRTPNHRPFLNNPIKSQVDEKSTALPSGPTYFCITYRPYRLLRCLELVCVCVCISLCMFCYYVFNKKLLGILFTILA